MAQYKVTLVQDEQINPRLKAKHFVKMLAVQKVLELPAVLSGQIGQKLTIVISQMLSEMGVNVGLKKVEKRCPNHYSGR